MLRPVDPRAIERAVRILRDGGLVAIPTETVYGLAADADSEQAVRAIFAAKGRPADHPVIVHIDNEHALDQWAIEVPDAARLLARAFWPGPLTMVLKRSARAKDVVTGGQDTVGLRVPAHPWMRAVLREFSGALAAPSANSFGRISPTTPQHVLSDLGAKPTGKVDLILDGGACRVGIESTIIDLSGDGPVLLRPGSITRAQLQNAVGSSVRDPSAQSPRASGRLQKHYAPRTPLTVLQSEALAGLLATPATARSERLAVLAPLHTLQNCRAQVTLAIAAPESWDEYARSLYSHLHRLDSSGADRLLVAAPPPGAQWEGVRDRLQRAQAGADRAQPK